MRCGCSVLRNFADNEAEKIRDGTLSRRLPADIQSVARRNLRMLGNADVLEHLRIPSASRLEALQGERKGQFSIRITDQSPICFRWIDDDAHAVEIVEYH